MAKFHINPFSGDPGLCRATVRECPWGDESEHFLTEPAARAAYEMKLKDEARLELFIKHAKSLDAYASSVDPDYIDRVTARVAEIDAAEEKETRRIDELRKEAPTRLKPRMNWLSEAQVKQINVEGVHCPHCESQVSPKNAAHILNEMNDADCTFCARSFDLHSIDIKVGESKDTYRAFDAAEVPKMTWYHSTNSEDWDSHFAKDGGFVAHLGSQQAAYDRRIAEDYSGAHNSEGFWIFEVRVSAEARIAETVDPDDNADYGGPVNERMKEADVVRYINKWEDMASISLAAKSSQLRVENKRFVTADEVMDSPSLYNVKPS